MKSHRIAMTQRHRYWTNAVAGALAGTTAQAAGLDVLGALAFAALAFVVLRLTTRRSEA